MQKNKIFKLQCYAISDQCYGICKSNNFVVFVKEMLVGEVANVKIITVKKNYAIGIIEELLIKSEERVVPKCKLASKCGGCDLQHLSYEAQLNFKKQMVIDYINTLKQDFKVLDIVGSEKIYNYRNKIQIPVKTSGIGFYRKHSNEVVDCDYCFLQSELQNEIYAFVKHIISNYNIKSYIRHIEIRQTKLNEIMLALIVNNFNIPFINEVTKEIVLKYHEIKSFILNLNQSNSNVILGEEEKLLYGRFFVYEQYFDLKVKLSLKSFYQVNPFQMERLYQIGLDMVKKQENMKILDLYCGIGTIGLYASRYGDKVTGVEIVEEAILNAKENAIINHIENASFYVDDSTNIDKYLSDHDLVIVDPPRKGLNDIIIESLNKSSVKQVLYISCNYKTLINDLIKLAKCFEVSDIRLVDMFPNTKHVESAVLLFKVQ